jgi:hypothetical protein
MNAKLVRFKRGIVTGVMLRVLYFTVIIIQNHQYTWHLSLLKTLLSPFLNIYYSLIKNELKYDKYLGTEKVYMNSIFFVQQN